MHYTKERKKQSNNKKVQEKDHVIKEFVRAEKNSTDSNV